MPRHSITVLLVTWVLVLPLVQSAVPHKYHALDSQTQNRQILDKSKLMISQDNRFHAATYYCDPKYEHFVTPEQRQTAASRFKVLGQYLSFDIYLFKALADKDMAKVKSYITPGLIIYILPFVLGLLLTILLSCCLAACCLKPKKCPPQCCRNESPECTRCQQLVPVIILIVLLTIALITATFGIVYSAYLRTTVSTIECSAADLADLALNGGVSDDQTAFFTGIKTIEKFLDDSLRNVTSMVESFSKDVPINLAKVTGMNRLVHDDLEYLGDLKKANTSFNLVYTSPTPSTLAPMTIPSSFNKVLGNPTQTISIIGGLYRMTDGVNIVSGILSQTTKGLKLSRFLVHRAAAQGKKYTKIFTKYVKLVDDETMKYLDLVDKSTAGVEVFYMLTFFFAYAMGLLGIAATIAFVFMGRTNCRKVLQATCCCTWFITLIGFITCVAFSVAIPALYGVCDPINKATSSKKELVKTVELFGLDKEIGKRIAVCFGRGSGKIIGEQVPHMVTANLNIVSQVLSISQFVASIDTSFLSFAADQTTRMITSYYQGQINDITDDRETRSWFRRLASGQEYKRLCEFSMNYQLDRLVPSTDPKSLIYVGCQNVAVVECKNITTCPQGCLDLSALMLGYNNVSSWTHDVAERYDNGPCGTVMAQALGTLYTNWHLKRIDPVNGIRGVLGRFKMGALPNIQAIERIIRDFKRNFTDNIETYKGLIAKVASEDSGMIAGLNCKPLVDKVMVLKDAICVRTFNNLYSLLIISGIVSFALLFANCCIVGLIVKESQLEKLKESANTESTYEDWAKSRLNRSVMSRQETYNTGGSTAPEGGEQQKTSNTIPQPQSMVPGSQRISTPQPNPPIIAPAHYRPLTLQSPPASPMPSNMHIQRIQPLGYQSNNVRNFHPKRL